MKFYFLAAAPLVFGWLTVIQAQNWVDSHSSKVGIETQEREPQRSRLQSVHDSLVIPRVATAERPTLRS
jgi:hypothetical protein